MAGQGTETVKGAHSDNSLTTAETDLKVRAGFAQNYRPMLIDLKTLIERFANSTSLDDLFDSLNQIYRDADNDPELKNWFKDIDTFVRKCLQEQGYILEDSSTEKWNKLYDHGNFLLRHRYRNHTDRILDEFKFLADQFDKDSQNKAFGDAVQKLFLDLGNDENGKPTFKPHLVSDLTDVILPAFFENIRYVPIPRIEYKDPMIDAVIENLVIEGDNLAPNVFEFGSDNYWRWGRRKIQNKNKNKIMLSVSGVQCDLRDVSYYVKKKEGFPSISDKGVMDVVLAGSGLSFKIALETADKSDQHHFFKVEKVDVSVKNMNIILKQSNHKLLFKLFKPLLLKVMNPVIQKVAEQQIREQLKKADAFLYKVHKEAEKAKQQIKDDPEQAANFYERYVNAARDLMAQGKAKKDTAAAAAADKEVNLAVTQHASIFPNIKLPGGISTKATEYKNLAAKGDKWESPIFSIGSAKESSNLPKPKEVARKPHRVTQGGVKDKSEVEGATSSGTGYNAGSSGAGYNTNQASSGQYAGAGRTTGQTGQGFGNQVDKAFSEPLILTNGGANAPSTL